jgi:L-cysteine/cystine lyase
VRTQPPERALETILAQVTPRTRLIALSHVSWQTGNVLPVEEIQDATGLPMLVDGAQTAGAIAVEARRYDFYTVSGQKWLCGPDATGGLYVREPETLHVALPTYFSQDGYDESGTFTPKQGAARFDSGWIPTPSLAGLEAALGTAPHWAAHHATEISARGWALLANRFEVATAPGQANLVSFVPGGDPAETARRLFDQGIVVRDMPGTGWLRISCGWWTSDEDLERLLASL